MLYLVFGAVDTSGADKVSSAAQCMAAAAHKTIATKPNKMNQFAVFLRPTDERRASTAGYITILHRPTTNKNILFAKKHFI